MSKEKPQYPPIARITTYSSGIIQSQVYRKLKKVTNAILKKHDISMMQWFILGTIYDHGDEGVRITELAKVVDVTLAFLTNTINILQARGMVERISHGTDNRSKLVRVTKSFSPAIPEIEASVRDDMRKIIYPGLTPDELELYIHILMKLASMNDKPIL